MTGLVFLLARLDAITPPLVIRFRFRCVKINAIKAPKASAEKATPTPIPAFAPLERLEDGCGVIVADGVPIVEAVAKVKAVHEEVV